VRYADCSVRGSSRNAFERPRSDILKMVRIQTNKVALLTDLYQLNMLSAYLDQDLTKTAVFELFVRKLPARRGFLMSTGLE